MKYQSYILFRKLMAQHTGIFFSLHFSAYSLYWIAVGTAVMLAVTAVPNHYSLIYLHFHDGQSCLCAIAPCTAPEWVWKHPCNLEVLIPCVSSVHEHFSSILGSATYRNKSNIKKLNQMKFRKSYKMIMTCNNLWLLRLQMSSDFKNLFHNYKNNAENI